MRDGRNRWLAAIWNLRQSRASAESTRYSPVTAAGGERPAEQEAAAERGAELVHGLGAAPGAAHGPVRVIATLADADRLQDGEVLVTHMTAPDWVPLMRKAAAIVTDSGGMTCHAAIVSRELGIPCVVGTAEATKVLRDGEVVTVDATSGVVTEGAMGSAEHPSNYTVFGREVNIASRLEAVSGSGRIIISETTFAEVARHDPGLAVTIQELPPLDLILLSHAHMDHYDIPSLRRLPRKVPIILARDTTEFMDGLGFTRTQELDWGQTAEVGGVRIEAVPAKHWGRRYPWDRDRGYNGFLLTKHKRSILFGGDTAYTERLPAAMHGRALEVAMLPIGGYNPYIANHANPEQAWDLWREMRARYLIPMHWRTFRMSHERPFEPYERLSTAVNGSTRRIALHTIGETWRLPG